MSGKFEPLSPGNVLTSSVWETLKGNVKVTPNGSIPDRGVFLLPSPLLGLPVNYSGPKQPNLDTCSTSSFFSFLVYTFEDASVHPEQQGRCQAAGLSPPGLRSNMLLLDGIEQGAPGTLTGPRRF